MCFAQVGIADIALPAIVGSNMVMQCSTDAARWRSAAPGERIHFSASWTDADTLATCVHFGLGDSDAASRRRRGREGCINESTE
ncbi:MAG: hypothetical protein IIB99_06995 [Planctomycetes bacterium]|nr:hypothetical protein [Planctomycetota bacterium]